MKEKFVQEEFYIVSFTRRGFSFALRVRDALAKTAEYPDEIRIHLYTKRDAVASEFSEVKLIPGSLKDWCGHVFSGATALVFIGAAGIAVRTIAPFLVSKTTDPAVLVADESGNHIISLLSGHLGGGNELAVRLAAQLGADPVITTASDVNERLSIDVWAKKNHCVIANLSAAKQVAAELVDGNRIPFYTDLPFEGELPDELVLQKSPVEMFDKNPEAGFCAYKQNRVQSDVANENIDDEKFLGRDYGQFCQSDWLQSLCHHDDISKNVCIMASVFRKDFRERDCLHLIPRMVVLGIGCKKGKSVEEIREVLTHILNAQNICEESIGIVASIDLKQNEPGILALAQEIHAPFVTFSAEELWDVPGEYAASAFVSEITGVDNVCERAAMAALAKKEQLKARFLCRKQAENGVTIALLLKSWHLQNEFY